MVELKVSFSVRKSILDLHHCKDLKGNELIGFFFSLEEYISLNPWSCSWLASFD